MDGEAVEEESDWQQIDDIGSYDRQLQDNSSEKVHHFICLFPSLLYIKKT